MRALFLILLAPAALAAVYRVGPGQALSAIGEVPWESLEAGDLVEIYWRDSPYHEKFNIETVGTVSRPVTVRGVPNAEGDLPILDARNASTRLALDFANEHRGVIRIGPRRVDVPDCWLYPEPYNCEHPQPVEPTDCPDPVFPPLPAYVVVENLDIRNSRDPHTFVDDEGNPQGYQSRSAAIYIEQGRYVTIRNCRFTDCGNGLFASFNTHDVTIEGCYFGNNGIIGSDRYHNAYTESHGITYQYNHFAPLREHALGSNIKDRSSGTVIRYNWIEGGNRQLDLVDSDHISIYEDPDHPYELTYIYGNILIEPGDIGNRQMIHYGGDTGLECQYRTGDCWFYNNTVISHRSGTTSLVRLTWGRFYCWNNIIYQSADVPIDFLENDGFISVSNNFLRDGFDYVEAVTNNNLFATDPGFADSAYTLLPDSVCIDAGRNPSLAGQLWPLREYVAHQRSIPRDTVLPLDIGAREATTPDFHPDARDDNYSTIEDRVLLVPGHQGVIANDHIDATYPSSLVLLSPPANGSLALNSDGSFRYQPAPGFLGSDSFSYGLIDAPPAITAFIGDDPDNGDGDYSPGDTLTIHFDRATNRPNVDVDQLFSFSQPIGSAYSGEWIARDQYRITLGDTGGHGVVIGQTTVTPAGTIPILNGPSTSAPSSASSPPLTGRFAVSDIQWTNGVFVTITGNRLAQIPERSSWLAGASSRQTIDYAPGVTHFAEWSVSPLETNVMVGFNDQDTTPDYSELDFAIYARFGGGVDIREHGVEIRVGVASWQPGDIFRIEVDDEVRYMVNGQLVYTSTQELGPERFPMVLDSSLANFAVVEDAIISVAAGASRGSDALESASYESVPKYDALSSASPRRSDPIADSATVTIRVQPDIRPPSATFANPLGTLFANTADLDFAITAKDPDGLATGWLISEDQAEPTLTDPRWSPSVPSTHTLAAEGTATLTLWVRTTEVAQLAQVQVIRDDDLRFGTLYVDDHALTFGYGAQPDLAQSAAPVRPRAVFAADLIADFRDDLGLTRWPLTVSGPATLSWDVSAIQDARRLLLQPPDAPAIDLMSSGSYLLRAGLSTFEIAHGPETSATLNLVAGWNLVGLPIMHTSPAPPNAWYWSGHAFRPASGLLPERGHWVFADSASTTSHSGILAAGVFRLTRGWNLYSPFTTGPIPAGMAQAWKWLALEQQLSPLEAGDVLFPGQAYWIHSPRNLQLGVR
jgi:hypothetical protein